MPCYQSNNVPSGYGKIGTGGYATEAECLEACKEGACCNGTTCSVKPQCQCDAEAGEVFKGVGTTCSPNPCFDCPCPVGDGYQLPQSISVYVDSPVVGSLFACQEPCVSIARSYAESVLQNTVWSLEESLNLDFPADKWFSMPLCLEDNSDCAGRVASPSYQYAHRIAHDCTTEPFYQAMVPGTVFATRVITAYAPAPENPSIPFLYSVSAPVGGGGWLYEYDREICGGDLTFFSRASKSFTGGYISISSNLSGCVGSNPASSGYQACIFEFSGTFVYDAVYANPLP